MMSFFAQLAANAWFSLKNPYPGCTALIFLLFARDMISSIFRYAEGPVPFNSNTSDQYERCALELSSLL